MITTEINNAVEQFNIEGLLSLISEQFGDEVMVRESSVFKLWFAVQRNQTNEDIETMKRYLIRKAICSDEYTATMVIERYRRLKGVLPQLTENTQQKLNKLKIRY